MPTASGEPVPVHLSAEITGAVRDLVRRGLDETSLDAFRTAHGVAWRLWMDICFGLTGDVDDLRELLDVSSLSISAFIEDTVDAMNTLMRAERAERARDIASRRGEAIALVLEGAPIPVQRAEAQLGYRLSGQRHLALWWMWFPAAPGPAAPEPFAPPALDGRPGVRIAAGRSVPGVDGFRESHFQATATQRLMADAASGDRRFARYDEVRLVAMLIGDPAAAQAYLTDTLGDLRDADTELVDTLRTWIRLRCNMSHTAEAMFTHRNTVVRRIARAEALLPRPLDTCMVDVAACLELLSWRR